MTTKNIEATESSAQRQDMDRPNSTLLKSWGKRLAKGNVPVIPVYIGGSWILNVPRGNKRVLRVVVPGKKASS